MALPEVGVQAVVKDFNTFMTQFGKMMQAGEAFGKSLEELSGSTDDTNKSLGDMGKATKDASKNLDQTGDSAVETAAKIEIMEKGFEAIRDLASEGLELAELGAQAERVEQRFAAFAEAAGGAEVILQAFQDGAGGTVSEMEAMQSATKLLQMGLVDDADSMEKVVEMATRLGDQTESASARTEGFALLLANQSIPRLDNYGISSGKVRARIEELQAETKGLSREQAFMQATMEEGSKSLLVLGDRVDDNAAKFEKAEARIADMRVELGQKLAPIFATVMSVVSGLSSEVLAFAGAIGTVLPLILKFSGGVSGLTTKLAGMPPQLGLIASAVVIAGVAWSEYNNQLKKVNAEQAKTEAVVAGLSDSIVAQVEAGGSLTEAMGQLGERTADTADVIDGLNTIQQVGLEVFGKSDDVTRQLAAAQQEAGQAALVASKNYGEYDAAIRAYNAGVGDADLMVKALTLDQFEQVKAMLDSGDAANVAAQFVRDFSLGQDDAAFAVEDLASETRFLTQDTDELAQAVTESQAAFEPWVVTAEEAWLASGELAGTLPTVSSTMDVMTRASEGAKAAQEEQARAAEDLAKAQEEARQSAADSAVAFSDLAQSLMDATAADIAKASLDRLGQSLKDGAIDQNKYDRASRELMLTFGLADEESLALAEGIDILSEAVDAGTLHTDDYTEAVDLLTDAAEDGKVSQEELLAPFERTPAVFGEAEDSISRVDDKLSDDLPASAEDSRQAMEDLATAEDAVREQADRADEAIGRVDDRLSDDLPPAAEEATGAVGDFNDALDRSGGLLDEVSEKAAGAGAATGHNFADGIISSIDEVIAATQAMAQGVINNMPSSEPKDPSSPLRGLGERGAAVVQNFSDGIIGAIPIVEDAVQQMGSAVVGGFGGGMPSDFGTLLDIGGAFSGLGGIAGKIFKREEVDPLKERAKGLEQRLKDLRKISNDIQKDMDKLGKKLLDETLTNQERLDIERQIAILRGKQLLPLEQINQAKEQSLAVNEELAEKQKILNDLQAEQETADFLKQQRDLLQTITEYGLDAGKVLQGIELGADADPSEIIKAMTLALRDVNRQLDSQIVNRDELIAQMEEEQRLAEAQARLAEAQQRQKFLQDQLALLALIEEKGLDANAILQGFEVGVDASLIDFTDAMARAIEAIIAQTEDELGIASPSKVFAAIGSEMMQGLAMGIANTAGMPAAQTMAATQAAMMAPSFAMPSMAGGSTTNIDAPISISATINNGADETRFFERVNRVVSASIRGDR